MGGGGELLIKASDLMGIRGNRGNYSKQQVYRCELSDMLDTQPVETMQPVTEPQGLPLIRIFIRIFLSLELEHTTSFGPQLKFMERHFRDVGTTIENYCPYRKIIFNNSH